MIDHWMEWLHYLSCKEGNTIVGVQKMIQGEQWVVPGETFMSTDWDLTTFGYSEKGNKMKALHRNYYNKERFQFAIKDIRKICRNKRYGSTQFPLTSLVKKGVKQTHCMSACSITNWPKEGLRVCIFYRTTEVTKKFGADLVFIRDTILPKIHSVRAVKDITFMFSNLTVHPMFFSTLFCHLHDPLGFLDDVREADPRFHDYIEKWLCKYMFYGDSGFVQKFSQANQTHRAFERMWSQERYDLMHEYLLPLKDKWA